MIKYFHQLKDKIQDLVDIEKISYSPPKTPMLNSNGAQHEQNRNLGIYKKPSPKLVTDKYLDSSVNFLEGYEQKKKRGTRPCRHCTCQYF